MLDQDLAYFRIYVFGEQINPQLKKKKKKEWIRRGSATIVKSQGNSKGRPVFNIPNLSSPPRVPWSLEATGHRFFQYNPSPRRGPQPTRDPKSTSSPRGSTSQRILSHFEILALKHLLAPGGGSSPGSRGDWHEPQETQKLDGHSFKSNLTKRAGGRHAGDRHVPYCFRFRLRPGAGERGAEGGWLLKGPRNRCTQVVDPDDRLGQPRLVFQTGKRRLFKNQVPSIHPTVHSRASSAVTFMSAKVPAAPDDFIKTYEHCLR